MTRKIGRFALAFAIASTLSASAWADGPSAQVLYDSGKADLDANRLTTACPALRRSYQLDPRPDVLFFYAQCEDRAGRITSAAAAYDDYLALFGRLSPSEQTEEKAHERASVQRREAIEKDIPKVTFKLPATVPDGLRVSRRLKDSKDPVPVAVGVPLPIDPGEHFVATEAPDRATWEKRFFIHKGEQLTVELSFAPPDKSKALRFSRPIEPVPNTLPPLNPGISGQRVAAYVTGGVGILSLLVSAVTGAITWGQKGTIAGNCTSADTTRICNSKGESAADLAKAAGTASTVTIVAGGVLLATGVILYVTEPSPTKLGRAPSPPSRLTFGVNTAPTSAAAVTAWTW